MIIESFIRALIYKYNANKSVHCERVLSKVMAGGSEPTGQWALLIFLLSETKDKPDQMQFCFYEGPPKVSCIPTPLHDAASFNTQLDWKSCKRTFISKAVASYEPSLNNVVAKLSIFDLFPPLSIFLVHGVYVHTGSFPLTRFSI